MPTWLVRCEKCRVDLNQHFVASTRDDVPIRHCEWCQRIQAWMPDLVAAIREALAEKK